MHDEITWINNARYFIHTLFAKNDEENCRRRTTILQPFHSPLAAPRIYENSISSRGKVRGGGGRVTFFSTRGTRKVMASRDRDDHATPSPRIYLFTAGIRLERANIPALLFHQRTAEISWQEAGFVRRSIFKRGMRGTGGDGAAAKQRNRRFPCSRYPRAWNFIVETLAEFVPPSRSLINGCRWKVFFGFISSLVAILSNLQNSKIENSDWYIGTRE